MTTGYITNVTIETMEIIIPANAKPAIATKNESTKQTIASVLVLLLPVHKVRFRNFFST